MNTRQILVRIWDEERESMLDSMSVERATTSGKIAEEGLMVVMARGTPGSKDIVAWMMANLSDLEKARVLTSLSRWNEERHELIAYNRSDEVEEARAAARMPKEGVHYNRVEVVYRDAQDVERNTWVEDWPRIKAEGAKYSVLYMGWQADLGTARQYGLQFLAAPWDPTVFPLMPDGTIVPGQQENKLVDEAYRRAARDE